MMHQILLICRFLIAASYGLAFLGSAQAQTTTSSAVDGACDSSNRADFTSAPTADLCSAGTASAVSGSGPWSWTCVGTSASCSALLARASSVPIIIQAVASSTNPMGIGISGNNFKIPLPNPVQTGDALVLAISYPDGLTPSIRDNLGSGGRSQIWPEVCVKAINSGQVDSAIYVYPHTANGDGTRSPTLTVSFISAVQPFQYDVLEISNIASSSPCNGIKSAGGVSVSRGAIDPGSFTPDANSGGNLIFTYVPCGLL